MRGPCFVLATLALLTPCAFASTYNASGGSSGFSGTGVFYTSTNANGGQTIDSMTGTGVTGLLAPGGFNNNDNLLMPGGSGPVLDGQGVSFTDTMGDTNFEVNLFSDASGDYQAEFLDSDGVSGKVPVTMTLTPATTMNAAVRTNLRLAVALQGSTGEHAYSFAFAPAALGAAVTPEPSSVALMGTGLLGLAGVVRRRLRQS